MCMDCWTITYVNNHLSTTYIRCRISPMLQQASLWPPLVHMFPKGHHHSNLHHHILAYFLFAHFSGRIILCISYIFLCVCVFFYSTLWYLSILCLTGIHCFSIVAIWYLTTIISILMYWTFLHLSVGGHKDSFLLDICWDPRTSTYLK